jgi:mercuric ion binding protein
MRKILVVLLVAVPVMALVLAQRTAVLDVQNMTCPVCPITIRKALERVSGVIAASVSYKDKTATVTYDPARTSPAALEKATRNAGFPATIHGEKQKP